MTFEEWTEQQKESGIYVFESNIRNLYKTYDPLTKQTLFSVWKHSNHTTFNAYDEAVKYINDNSH